MIKDVQNHAYKVMDRIYFLFLFISLIVCIITQNLRMGFIVFISGVIITFLIGNIYINYKIKKQ